MVLCRVAATIGLKDVAVVVVTTQGPRNCGEARLGMDESHGADSEGGGGEDEDSDDCNADDAEAEDNSDDGV